MKHDDDEMVIIMKGEEGMEEEAPKGVSHQG